MLGAYTDAVTSGHGVVTKTSLIGGLDRLGLRAGAVVAVHSSLASFGRVVGGADTILEALMEAVGPDGSIVMSAYPLSKPVPLAPGDAERGIAWKVRQLRPDRGVPSGMGVIADRFRDRKDVVLGNQTIHRVAAWGRKAERLAEGYHRLLELDGLVLLLGVDMDRASVLHQAEHRVPLPSSLAAELHPPDEVQRAAERLYPPDEWILGYAVPFVNFVRVREVADERGIISQTAIGNATARLFRAVPVVDLYAELRREQPDRLIDRADVRREDRRPPNRCSPDQAPPPLSHPL